MNNLAFLLLAVVVSVIGAGVVIVRNRPPVGRTEIDEFQAVMGALAPDRERSPVAGPSNDTAPASGAAGEPDLPPEAAPTEGEQ